MNQFYDVFSVVMTPINVLLLLIAFFMIGRDLVCWYWRITERIRMEKRRNVLLEDISANLKLLLDLEEKRAEHAGGKNFTFEAALDNPCRKS